MLLRALLVAGLFGVCGVEASAQTLVVDTGDDFEPPPVASTPATSSTTEVSGSYSARLGLDTGHEDRCDDFACEDVFDLANRLEARIVADPSDSFRVVVGGRVEHRLVGERPPGETFTVSNAERVKAHAYADLGELYVRYRPRAEMDLTIGRQIVAWGVLDTASPQDILNPVDYRSGLVPSAEPPRLPVFAARLELRTPTASLDAVLLPFFEPHRVSLFGSDAAVLRSGAGPLGSPLVNLLLSTTDPSQEDELQPLLLSTERPQEKPQNARGAVRAGARLGAVDLHLAYVYGWDRVPTIQATNSSATGFSSRYERLQTVAIDATTTLGPLTVRAEAGWTPERTLYDADLTPRRLATTLSGLGLDYVYDGRVTATIETFWLHVFDADDDLYLLDADTLGVALAITGRWWDNRLAVRAVALTLPASGDRVAAPEIGWKLADADEVSLGLQLFEGEDGPGGLMDANDQLTVGYKTAF